VMDADANTRTALGELLTEAGATVAEAANRGEARAKSDSARSSMIPTMCY